jgi:acyl-CoA dehydrogenase
MDLAFSSEDLAFRDDVRGFLRDHLPAELARRESQGFHLSRAEVADWQRTLYAKGWVAPNWPKEFGGTGWNAIRKYIFDVECGIANAPEISLIALSMVGPVLCRFGSPELQRRFLDPILRGDLWFCQGFSEPQSGSDLASVRTRAVRDGDDYVIDGTKHFISHADKSDFVILFAATGTEEVRGRKANLITGFLVDLDTPGLTVVPGPKSVSHRGYHHSELVFEGCRVPAANRLGEEGRGFDLMGEWLGASRLTVAATSVGRARRVLDMTVQWAADRQQFGQPIGKFQGVSFQLADMATELDAAELLTLRAAWKLDQGTMTDQDAAMAKVFASEALGRITDRALQIHGGMGLMEELPIERFWRDARVERIWDGTSEIQRHIISRSLLRPLGV